MRYFLTPKLSLRMAMRSSHSHNTNVRLYRSHLRHWKDDILRRSGAAPGMTYTIPGAGPFKCRSKNFIAISICYLGVFDRRALVFTCASGRCLDNGSDLLRKGDQGIVATFDNGLRRLHSISKKVLSTRIEHKILIGNNEPGRLGVPSGVTCRVVKGGMVDGLLLIRENFSFLFRKVPSENSWKGGLVNRQEAFVVRPNGLNAGCRRAACTQL